MGYRYEYSSDFAQGLQYFIDIGEIRYAHEDLLNPDNFSEINDTSLNDRYELVHQIITKMPRDIDEQSEGALPYTESVAFLLTSIPYEPLAQKEEDTAFKLASMFTDLDIDRHYSLDDKLEICRAISQIYSEIYGLNGNVPIGTIWPKNNASKKAKDYFNHVAAFYTPRDVAILKDKYECESDLEDHQYQAIIMNRDELEKLSITEMIPWIIHELRHNHQRDYSSLNVLGQQEGSVSKRVNKFMHKAVYFALMEERQAYAFDGWVDDHIRGNMKRSELQITCDRLWHYGLLSGKAIDAIHDFEKHINKPKAITISPTQEPIQQSNPHPA